jgi:glucose-1-phosphatase
MRLVQPVTNGTFELLIFDVGGVMVDGFDVRPEIAAHLSLEPGRCNALLKAADFQGLQAGRMSVDEYWRSFSALAGAEVDEDLWATFFRPTRRPAMYELVEQLKRRFRVVAGTNTLGPHYVVHQSQGDYDIFHATYASHLLYAAKPSPDFFEAIVRAEAVEPGAALFVDDVEENVEGARLAGLHALHFTGVEALREELDELLRP